MRSPRSALSPDGHTCVSGARRLAHLLLPLLLTTAFPASAAETLADAWQAALAVDGRLRAADADADAARASLEAARGLALPKATASSSYTVLSKEPAARIGLPTLPGIALPDQMPLAERTYATHALQATLPIYTGGRITAAINAADIGVQASAFERSRSEQAVKLEVASHDAGHGTQRFGACLHLQQHAPHVRVTQDRHLVA